MTRGVFSKQASKKNNFYYHYMLPSPHWCLYGSLSRTYSNFFIQLFFASTLSKDEFLFRFYKPLYIWTKSWRARIINKLLRDWAQGMLSTIDTFLGIKNTISLSSLLSFWKLITIELLFKIYCYLLKTEEERWAD